MTNSIQNNLNVSVGPERPENLSNNNCDVELVDLFQETEQLIMDEVEDDRTRKALFNKVKNIYNVVKQEVEE
jgi:hypothetical protein